MTTIKAGYLISYDYEFVKTSLPRIYDFVDEIYFAVDVDGKTWSGGSLEIDPQFWEWVKAFDKEQKITIYKDHFYLPGLAPMECDTRERNLLGKRMGKADWYIQIDSDEYFVDFEAFIKRLKTFHPEKPTSIYCSVATLFKELPAGFLLIDDSFETLSFATNHPVYDLARNNNSGNEQLHWDNLMLHQSWARTTIEIQQKLDNWSHKDDFNTKSFFKLWDAIDENNYNCLRDFHPLNPVTWPKLIFFRGTINEILNSEQLKSFKTNNQKPVKNKSFLSRLWKKLKD
ncbi:hypothetical protein [Pedobacter gandavensis]|uniref:hypothetical protein n=1 Tax=Pedobacter gandavensis TaxID=2679963 RepID=UPI00292F6E12|nr:hypothetical protein [Pedobacter gandavensis]